VKTADFNRYRRRVKALVKAAKAVSVWAWNTPTEDNAPGLEVTKTAIRRLDKALERLEKL
jgi:hypothetical protein